MAIFFFFVTLEIKREFLQGELSNIKQALLPIIGAVGGMLVPALIYVFINITPDGFFKSLECLEKAVKEDPNYKEAWQYYGYVLGWSYSIFKVNSIDIIHAHGKGAGVISRILRILINKPLIYTFHGIHLKCHHWHKRLIYILYEYLTGWIDSYKILVSKSEKNYANLR